MEPFMKLSKRLLANAAALCAAAAIATPAMATNYTLTPEMTGVGSYSYDINDLAPGKGTFTDTFTFTIPGVLDGTVVAGVINVGTGLNNIDILSSSLTGAGAPIALAVSNVGAVSTAVTNDLVNVIAGHTYVLHVTYKASGPNDMLNGNVAFVDPPAAAPEPAAWALMMLGFGAIGYGMRTSARGRRAAALA
jgi:hypothetical protein